VAGGKPQAVFITGEYGIGKTSLARVVRVLEERSSKLLGFHIMLGTAASLEDIATKTVQDVLETPDKTGNTIEKIRSLLAEYVGEQSLFGFKIRLDRLRKDAPDISRGYLPFLRSIYQQVSENYKGLVLVLDEINGMAGKKDLALFLKDLVDENAVSDHPLPLLLILCGTEERYRQIIQHHHPVERIFQVPHISPMTGEEMSEFFERAFGQVGMCVDGEGMRLLCRYSGGLPKLMHLVGDAAFWIAPENEVDIQTAMRAIIAAAEDVGRKFVDQQVYKALRSKSYQSILRKLARLDFDLVFKKSDVDHGLSQEERKRLNNFLQRMKKLNVLTSGDEKGEYAFRDRLTRLYLRMEAMEKGPR